MKRYSILFVTILGFFYILGCSSEKHEMKKKTVNIDGVLSYKIYDSEKIVESKADGKIYVDTVKFPLSSLRNFESKSYSETFLNLVKNAQGNIFEKIDAYLNSYDFSCNNYALYNNRFDSVDESGANKKRFSNQPVIYNGKVIGELIYRDNSSHCFSYVLLYVSSDYLFTTTIELYRIDPCILEKESNYFEKKNNEFLPYHWISESKRKEFYELLESDEFKNLPEDFQLLRQSKDLFLSSLTRGS